MPGRILEVLTEVGAKVSAGDPLIRMEAKMLIGVERVETFILQ